jgi:hypothetical protein
MEEIGGVESMLLEFITPLSGRRARLRARSDRDLYSIVHFRCIFMATLTIHERRLYRRYVCPCVLRLSIGFLSHLSKVSRQVQVMCIMGPQIINH